MKNDNLLEIKNLHVSAGEKEILHGVNLTVGKDETHVFLWVRTEQVSPRSATQ